MTQLAKDYRRIFKLTPKQAQRIADKGIELCGWCPRKAGETLTLIGRINHVEVRATAEEFAA